MTGPEEIRTVLLNMAIRREAFGIVGDFPDRRERRLGDEVAGDLIYAGR